MSTVAIPSQHQLRAELEAMVLGDLLGPAGGDNEELTERSARDRYLVGVLAPSRGARDEGRGTRSSALASPLAPAPTPLAPNPTFLGPSGITVGEASFPGLRCGRRLLATISELRATAIFEKRATCRRKKAPGGA